MTALAYLITLAALVLGLNYVGERWWVTTALLYIPRVALAVPLPFFVTGLVLTGQRRLLWTQLVALLVLLFPLMGLVLPGPTAGRDAHGFRLLSLNANSGYAGADAIFKELAAADADIVLIQEGPFWGGQLCERLRPLYPNVAASTQFAIASRFPILATTDPDRLPYYGRQRSPRFMRYLIDTPLGKVAFYSIHPISPRGALHIHRFHDALHAIRTGAILSGDPEADLGANTGLRALQVATAAELATHEQVPVIIAGDTNLPGLSAILRKNLSGYDDAFRSSGSGFGYTFPDKHPFLRLDRIFLGPELRSTSFRVGCRGISDHLCVVAEIGRRP